VVRAVVRIIRVVRCGNFVGKNGNLIQTFGGKRIKISSVANGNGTGNGNFYTGGN